MSFYRTGRLADFLILAILWILFYISSKLGQNYRLRRIAALEAIEGSIDRAKEMGRPALQIIGPGYISRSSGEYAACQYAGLSLLGYISRFCAEKGVRLIVPCGSPDRFSMEKVIVRAAYEQAGKLEDYDEDEIHIYVSEDSMAHAAAVMGIIERERPSIYFPIGRIGADVDLLNERAKGVGAEIIGGAYSSRNANLIVPADYIFLGEELYTAAAMASGDKESIGTVVGQDFGKLFVIAVVVIGVILVLSGNSIVKTILGS
jgi:hypothetical protein